MKKVFLLILVMLVALTSTLLLTSCGDDTVDSTPSTDSMVNDSTPESNVPDSTPESTPNSTPESTVDSTPHEHTIADSWSSNKDGHYKAYTCHPTVIENVVEHTDTKDNDGKCDECEYVMVAPTTFTVTVKDDLSNLVSDATVKIYTDSKEFTITTDENGIASCEFVYFTDVYASILSIPNGLRNDYTEPLLFDGTSLNVELTSLTFFEVFIINENEEGIANIEVSFAIPETTVNTNENGIAYLELPTKELENNTQYFTISELPSGYGALNIPLNALIDIEYNSTFTVNIVPVATFTFKAVNQNGEAVPYARVKDTSTGEEYSLTKDGTLSVTLIDREHTFEFYHNSSFYSINSEATVNLTAQDCPYTIVFEESSELEWVVMSVKYDDGSDAIPSETQIYYYNPDSYDTEGLLAIASNGKAVANMYHQSRIFLAFDKDHNYGYYYYEKGEDTNFTITITKGATLGKSMEHPVPINAVLKSPFTDDAFLLFDFDVSFEAGESLYVEIWNALGRTVSIDGNNFTMEYQGTEILPDNDGRISLTFTSPPENGDAVIKITAKADAIDDIEIDDSGTLDTPLYVFCPPEDLKSVTLTLYEPNQVIYVEVTNGNSRSGILSTTVEGTSVTLEGITEEPIETFYSVLVKVIANEQGEVTITFSFEPVE